MTRKELLRSAHDMGLDLKWYQVAYALSTGKLAEPESDGSGRFIYGPKHLRQLLEIFGARQEASA